MEFVHLDYYTDDATALDFSLITGAYPEEAYDIDASESFANRTAGLVLTFHCHCIQMQDKTYGKGLPIQNRRQWNGLFG